ncbi:hypothetical protein DH2020_042117 [Rehmannia glutinosa]|uniref:FCP1 homology domain-containing protein n=1 Tax=Rehmannia glutinosa TaxID=99300 RepID=A0ABR0UN95_REHGL
MTTLRLVSTPRPKSCKANARVTHAPLMPRSAVILSHGSFSFRETPRVHTSWWGPPTLHVAVFDRCCCGIVINIKRTDQMPSLRMKTKSTTGCLKEKDGLQVCRKSSMISKNSLSRARVSQTAEEICVYTQSDQDAPVYDKVYAQDNGGDEAKPNELSNEEKLFQKQPSTVTNSAADSMDPTLSTCTSNIDTIFSPILESMGFYNNEGSDNLYMPQLDSEDSDDSSRNSCKYPACNVSDFYVSDMIFSGPPIVSNAECDSRTDTVFLPDYQNDESSLLCDLTEEYMESHIHTYPDQDYECFDPQTYIRNLPDQSDIAFAVLPTPVPNDKQNTKQITLVLDLDETLVHSTLDHCDDADFTFPLFFDMKERTVYVKQRPHLKTFLKRVAEMFEIVVFTASQSIYAKQLLDILDPDGNVISRRAYRESCIVSEGSYMKDLTVLGVDLAKVAIIDNSPQDHGTNINIALSREMVPAPPPRLQVNNGIPIESWFNDPSDNALISLLPFLETLVDADDVRPIIARKFGLLEEIRFLGLLMPSRVMVMSKKGRGFGAICYSAPPLTPRNLQWVSTVATAYVLLCCLDMLLRV